MKFLIIGLGSMGKRRIRNLQYLNAGEIIGFDFNLEKRDEAREKYGIATFESLNNALSQKPDALIISTPPDKHNEYIRLAIDKKIPAFVEASVLIEGLKELDDLSRENKVFIAPSCTFRFHPAIAKIKEIVKDGKYGKVTNFTYYLGQYLPDWHPSENIKNFYVGKKETSGAREMVSFELTWITDILGLPENITGFFGKTLDMGVDIDDTYAFAMDFGDKFGSMLIDVVSRYATRSLTLNLENAQICWRWDEDCVKIYEAGKKDWTNITYKKLSAALGYNENITEEMYIEEMKTFAGAVGGKNIFPNTLEDDIRVLQLLNKIEQKQAL
ncbi:MAG: Gfo/Idh/MocA family oxidoreductase [Minisyncoccales bacterium]